MENFSGVQGFISGPILDDIPRRDNHIISSPVVDLDTPHLRQNRVRATVIINIPQNYTLLLFILIVVLRESFEKTIIFPF